MFNASAFLDAPHCQKKFLIILFFRNSFHGENFLVANVTTVNSIVSAKFSWSTLRWYNYLCFILTRLSFKFTKLTAPMRVNQYTKKKETPQSKQVNCGVDAFWTLLIIHRSAHFCQLLGEANHLTGITVFIIIPNVQHNAFLVCGNNRRLAVKYGRTRVADHIARH